MDTLAPQLLTDPSRLPEIYALRVTAWEQSPGSQHVNSLLFPNGWMDKLDTHPKAYHWILEDKNCILAAAHVKILEILEECGQDFTGISLPSSRLYEYISQLVIAPLYRKQQIVSSLDKVRLEFLKKAEVAFALASPIPKRVDQLLGLGWHYLGNFSYQWRADAPKQHPGPWCIWLPQNALLWFYFRHTKPISWPTSISSFSVIMLGLS